MRLQRWGVIKTVDDELLSIVSFLLWSLVYSKTLEFKFVRVEGRKERVRNLTVLLWVKLWREELTLLWKLRVRGVSRASFISRCLFVNLNDCFPSLFASFFPLLLFLFHPSFLYLVLFLPTLSFCFLFFVLVILKFFCTPPRVLDNPVPIPSTPVQNFTCLFKDVKHLFLPFLF